MSNTVLFFGDSNTRGYGVGRHDRYAAVAETLLRGDCGDTWQFVVGSSMSDFRVITDRLAAALTKHAPRIVVFQCPTGPASFFVNYPLWVTTPRRAYRRLLDRLREHYVRVEVSRTQRSRYDVVYDGHYLNRLHLWKPWHLPGLLTVRRWLVRRHGTVAKTTGDRYVELVCRLRDGWLAQTPVVLFLGLLPSSDEYYPGYAQRAAQWGAGLTTALHQPSASRFYLDVHGPLTRGGTRQLLLRDGTHLSVEAHRQLAALVVPELRRLMQVCDEGHA